MRRDAAGGAVIAVVIVVSCLSLVSFVEYLRFQEITRAKAESDPFFNNINKNNTWTKMRL